ncbi:MAG: hypothetical protein EON47_21645, partial [Acetobacteraceae bacterium]
MPALTASLARLRPPGRLRGILAELPARASRCLSGLLRTVADRLAGLPADALPSQAALAPPPRPVAGRGRPGT